MLGEPDPQKKSALKNPFLYSWAALAVAALVVCGILFFPLAGKTAPSKDGPEEERTQKLQEQESRHYRSGVA